MKRRLNIVIVMADQLAPSALRIHGGPAKAPHLEALAAEGVIFDAAYCNSPLCSPSRVSFITGRLPSRIGVYDNAAEFCSDIPTFAHHLRLAGYRTVLAGKMHFCGADQLHGFEERLTTDIYPADFGWTPDWDHPHARPSWYHSMSSVIAGRPLLALEPDRFRRGGHLRGGAHDLRPCARHGRAPALPRGVARPIRMTPSRSREHWWERYRGKRDHATARRARKHHPPSA